jgi:hypothetical protein
MFLSIIAYTLQQGASMTFKAMKFKVNSEEHCSAIQQELFKMGYKWMSPLTELEDSLDHLYAGFLFTGNLGYITFCPKDAILFFNRQSHTLTELSTLIENNIKHKYEQTVCETFILKETNPKDAIGSSKLPLNLVPDSLLIYASTAFAEGGSKYSPYNWRIAGVRASVYKAAHDRHMSKWWNGEDCDQATGVKHLASAIACLGIILDAELLGKLNDDRPPYAPIATLMEECEKVVKHVREMHKDCVLKEYRLADYPKEAV